MALGDEVGENGLLDHARARLAEIQLHPGVDAGLYPLASEWTVA
jgi:hypothetical protein